MINTRLTALITTFALSTVFLSGCSSERDVALSAAQSASAKGDYEAAYQNYQSAVGMKAFSDKESEIKSAYEETVNKLYVMYYTNGNDSFEQKDFDKSLEWYKKAYTLSNHDENLVLKIKETTAMIDKQEALDEYVLFTNNIIKESNVVLRTLDKNIESSILGKLPSTDFIANMKALLPQASTLVSNVDNQIISVKNEYSTIHKDTMDFAEYIQSTIVNAIDGSDMYALTDNYRTIKEMQSTIIQSLQSYADSEGIAYRVIEDTQFSSEQKKEPGK